MKDEKEGKEFTLVGKLNYVNFMCNPPKIEMELDPSVDYKEFQKFLLQYGMTSTSVDARRTTLKIEIIKK